MNTYGRPNRKITRKNGSLKRLSSLTGWDFSAGLFRSIHIFLGFPSSSRPFGIGREIPLKNVDNFF